MSNVSLLIGGRSYTVATSPGDEERIKSLGALIDDRVQALGAIAGQSEARQLLFAALFLADELEQQRAAGGPAAPVTPSAPGPDIAAALESLADRLEEAASALEAPLEEQA
jgi:cell division protein ZapA